MTQENLLLDSHTGYLVAFRYLDKLFWQYNDMKPDKVEDLGILLSSMNPFLFENNYQAADPALSHDWEMIFGVDNEELKVTDVFFCLQKFIELQCKWLKLSFPIQLLQKVRLNDEKDTLWNLWLQSISDVRDGLDRSQYGFSRS